MHPPSANYSALDQVAVEISATVDTVILKVAHHSAFIAYPVLIDPKVQNTYTWSPAPFPNTHLADSQARHRPGSHLRASLRLLSEVPNRGPYYGAASPTAASTSTFSPSDLFLRTRWGASPILFTRSARPWPFVAVAYSSVPTYTGAATLQRADDGPFLRGTIIIQTPAAPPLTSPSPTEPRSRRRRYNNGCPNSSVAGRRLRSGSSPFRTARSAPGTTSQPAAPRSCSATRRADGHRRPRQRPRDRSRTWRGPRRSTPHTFGSGLLDRFPARLRSQQRSVHTDSATIACDSSHTSLFPDSAARSFIYDIYDVARNQLHGVVCRDVLEHLDERGRLHQYLPLGARSTYRARSSTPQTCIKLHVNTTTAPRRRPRRSIAVGPLRRRVDQGQGQRR